MKLIIFTILSLCNTLIRGGLIETMLGVENISGLRYGFSIMFGVGFYVVSGMPEFGVLMATAMHLGSIKGLQLQEMLNGNWKPMTIRGMIWTTPLMAVMAYFYGLTALWYLPAFFLMFPTYYIPKIVFDHIESNKIINRHTVAEVLYGDLLCLPILFIT